MRSLLIENVVDLFCGSTTRPPDGETVVDTLRTSTATRWRCARQLRANTRSMLAARRSSRRAAAHAIRQALHRHRAAVIASLRRRGGVELWASATERPAQPVEDVLRSQVLQSIQSHVDGVAAIDIANELGVDWRRVCGAAQGLVAEGTIEQVEQELYPARKGRRT
jgi:non-ribosomal peptide synthetase component E (peptide arylation enzyme)